MIEPVGYSDWTAAVVPVAKEDGLCGDFKLTMNQLSFGRRPN